MEKKDKRNQSPSNNIKSKSLIDKNQNKNIPLNQSINAKILNKLGIILSPSSYLSRNSDKDILSIKKFKEYEKGINTTKIKLTKNSKKSSILPNISIQKNKKNKNTFLYSVKSTKNFKNKIFQNNFSNNKTINSFFQTPKAQNEEKNKIRKISTAFLLNKSTNITDTNTQNKKDKKKYIESIDKKNKKEIKIKIKNNNTNNEYTYTDINLGKLIKETKFYSPNKDNKKTLIDDFLNCKNGIFNLSDFNRKLLCKNVKMKKPVYKKENIRNIILKKIKNKKFFSQIKKDNDLMKQKIKNDYNSLNELKKKI